MRLASGAQAVGRTSEKVIEFCLAENAFRQEKIRH